LFLIRLWSKRNRSTLERIKNQNLPINILFIIRHVSQWKYQGIYELFSKDKDFKIQIIIAADNKNASWKHDQELALSKFKDFKCEVIDVYGRKGNLSINPSIFSADIVFFPKPLEGKDSFSIRYFPDSLCCYVPYSTYGDNNPNMQYNRIFHNLLWRHYVATEIHLKISKQVNYRRSRNIRVSGYPGFDNFLFPKQIKRGKNITWPNDSRKRIIWAPHHTIENSNIKSNHSNFLLYQEFFKTMAQKFRNDVFIAFKPHPNLRFKLYELEGWKKAKTDEYYKWWSKTENTLLVEGEYENLFLNSDALIHDSVSFMAEYLCLGKPSCYLIKNKLNLSRFLNEFGLKLLNFHTLANDENEINHFVEKLITTSKQTCEIPEFLRPNEITSCEYIYNDIRNSIFN